MDLRGVMPMTARLLVDESISSLAFLLGKYIADFELSVFREVLDANIGFRRFGFHA